MIPLAPGRALYSEGAHEVLDLVSERGRTSGFGPSIVYAVPLLTKALCSVLHMIARGGNAAPAGHVRERRTEQLTSTLVSGLVYP